MNLPCYIKGTIFFYADKFIGHSFIQIRKSCLFFPKPYFWSEKNKMYFFFPRKSSSAIHSDFEEPPIFLIKMCCVFSPSFLCVFLFFFSAEKFTCHSFIRFSRSGKKTTREKKTAFSFIQKISPKSAQKRSYPGKTKIRYLWLHMFYVNFSKSLFYRLKSNLFLQNLR